MNENMVLVQVIVDFASTGHVFREATKGHPQSSICGMVTKLPMPDTE